MRMRRGVKHVLACVGSLDRTTPTGVTILTYHRVGGHSGDELDCSADAFRSQLELINAAEVEVVSLEQALDRIESLDPTPAVVLSFDDGFADLHDVAFPLLRERDLPFTLYLAAGLVGGRMAWEGSAAFSQGAPALTWDQVRALAASGLCTVANHTTSHAGPQTLDIHEIDECSRLIEAELGERPRHFAWTWGVPVPNLMPAVRSRFRSAATGALGRNPPGADLHALRRVPVRASDPLAFFKRKLTGSLRVERANDLVVASGKAIRGLAGRG